MRQPCALRVEPPQNQPEPSPILQRKSLIFQNTMEEARASQQKQNSLTPPAADWLLHLLTSPSHRSSFSGWKRRLGFVLGENRAGTLSACAACKHPFFLPHEHQGAGHSYTNTHRNTHTARKRLTLEIFITFSNFTACQEHHALMTVLWYYGMICEPTCRNSLMWDKWGSIRM